MLPARTPVAASFLSPAGAPPAGGLSFHSGRGARGFSSRGLSFHAGFGRSVLPLRLGSARPIALRLVAPRGLGAFAGGSSTRAAERWAERLQAWGRDSATPAWVRAADRPAACRATRAWRLRCGSSTRAAERGRAPSGSAAGFCHRLGSARPIAVRLSATRAWRLAAVFHSGRGRPADRLRRAVCQSVRPRDRGGVFHAGLAPSLRFFQSGRGPLGRSPSGLGPRFCHSGLGPRGRSPWGRSLHAGLAPSLRFFQSGRGPLGRSPSGLGHAILPLRLGPARPISGLRTVEARTVERRARLLFGAPQLAAREPPHHRVGMLRLDLLERRQQLLAASRSGTPSACRRR